VIAIGLGSDLAQLRECREVTRIDNEQGIDNDERGTPVYVCAGPRTSWSDEWPTLEHLG
jgi:hypothetical protein